jgi:WhiB family transcriptional regulator, redox-sensing transcriptional regulator
MTMRAVWTDLRPVPDQAASAASAPVGVRLSRGWARRAACRGADPELFYPVGTAGPAQQQVDAAKAICAHCPVQNACLDWALRVGEAHGVWGGTTPEERRWLRAPGACANSGTIRP